MTARALTMYARLAFRSINHVLPLADSAFRALPEPMLTAAARDDDAILSDSDAVLLLHRAPPMSHMTSTTSNVVGCDIHDLIMIHDPVHARTAMRS